MLIQLIRHQLTASHEHRPEPTMARRKHALSNSCARGGLVASHLLFFFSSLFVCWELEMIHRRLLLGCIYAGVVFCVVFAPTWGRRRQVEPVQWQVVGLICHATRVSKSDTSSSMSDSATSILLVSVYVRCHILDSRQQETIHWLFFLAFYFWLYKIKTILRVTSNSPCHTCDLWRDRG